MARSSGLSRPSRSRESCTAGGKSAAVCACGKVGSVPSCAAAAVSCLARWVLWRPAASHAHGNSLLLAAAFSSCVLLTVPVEGGVEGARKRTAREEGSAISPAPSEPMTMLRDSVGVLLAREHCCSSSTTSCLGAPPELGEAAEAAAWLAIVGAGVCAVGAWLLASADRLAWARHTSAPHGTVQSHRGAAAPRTAERSDRSSPPTLLSFPATGGRP